MKIQKYQDMFTQKKTCSEFPLKAVNDDTDFFSSVRRAF